MRSTNLGIVTAGLLALSLALLGCGQSKQEKTASPTGNQSSVTQAVHSGASKGKATEEELQAMAESRFNDARLYCLGMVLYATKNQNVLPMNLDQTLPYLREANRLPSGTNQFEILYHGSLDKLPNPSANGIIVIRSQAWQESDGRWSRVYGFADGHCETHSEADKHFAAWEKQRLPATSDGKR